MDLETRHDYIQFMFPSTEVSQFNSVAPVVTEEVMEAFRQEESMRLELLLNLRRIAQFWDFSLSEEPDNISFSLKPEFHSKPSSDVIFRNTSKFHNFLRLTRVIKSLYALGLEPYAYALKKFAIDVLKDTIKVPLTTVKFWRDSIPDPTPAVLVEKGSTLSFPPQSPLSTATTTDLDDSTTKDIVGEVLSGQGRTNVFAEQRRDLDVDKLELQKIQQRLSLSQEMKFTEVSLNDEQSTPQKHDRSNNSEVGNEEEQKECEYSVSSFSVPRHSDRSYYSISSHHNSNVMNGHEDIADVCQICQGCMKSVM